MKSLVGRSPAVAAIALVLLATEPAAATSPVSFAPYQAYPVGSRAESVAIADVTADGLPDVLLTASYGFSDPSNNFRLFVFPQMPDGTLGTPVKYATDGQYSDPMGVDTGDLNGDGRADVAVATTSGIDVFYQAAGGGLLPPELIVTSNRARRPSRHRRMRGRWPVQADRQRVRTEGQWEVPTESVSGGRGHMGGLRHRRRRCQRRRSWRRGHVDLREPAVCASECLRPAQGQAEAAGRVRLLRPPQTGHRR